MENPMQSRNLQLLYVLQLITIIVLAGLLILQLLPYFGIRLFKPQMPPGAIPIRKTEIQSPFNPASVQLSLIPGFEANIQLLDFSRFQDN